MRLFASVLVVALGSSIPPVSAWGSAGHQIVATVAQMYLHPKVLPILCNILQMPHHNCHIATIASWADQHRNQMRWSGPMHYINPVDDNPSQTCAFPGQHGWRGSRGINVLDAVKNTTGLLQSWVDNEATDSAANEALKFLVHFIGDMHQPLHLTGRAKGGNSVKVLFGRRHANLHSVWDTYLIAKALRSVPHNYSRPLPYPEMEKALRGTIYDSYIRRLLWEGVLHPWADELPSWLDCPPVYPESSSVSSAIGRSGLMGMWQTPYAAMRKIIDLIAPKEGVEINPDGPYVCPYFWAQPLHDLNCQIAWPKELDDDYLKLHSFSRIDLHQHDHELDEVNSDSLSLDLIDLDTPEYSGVIETNMIIEKLLARGGIRLAGVLNYIFAQDDRANLKGPFVWDFRNRRGPPVPE